LGCHPLGWEWRHTPQNKYQELLEKRRNNDNKFDKLQGLLLGQDVLEMLAGDFEILHSLKGIFKNLPQPSYERYTNLDELVRNMNKTEYPMGKVWHCYWINR
jgi:hypothetical protein